MQNIIFNIHLYSTSTQAHAHGFCSSVGRALVYRFRVTGSLFPAGGLGVAFFATDSGWVLKCIRFWDSNLPCFKNINAKDCFYGRQPFLWLENAYCKTTTIKYFALFNLFGNCVEEFENDFKIRTSDGA